MRQVAGIVGVAPRCTDDDTEAFLESAIACFRRLKKAQPVGSVKNPQTPSSKIQPDTTNVYALADVSRAGSRKQ